MSFEEYDTTRLDSDRKSRLGADARKPVDAVSLSPELLDGGDALPVERVPSVERQPEPADGALAVLKKPLIQLFHFPV
ncbi:hypothetical protein [Microvirga aerophila]|uniref:Uncharacterized protein n=1 Tax=Microvirga aerophila TaxID=670291 RepID=A0A512BXE4_9HYPH|nr:hypothetical protein [Microvirga aerophila]GEO16625.1 hypothetical protein MAE02_43210 [Microvirga aerophila]